MFLNLKPALGCVKPTNVFRRLRSLRAPSFDFLNGIWGVKVWMYRPFALDEHARELLHAREIHTGAASGGPVKMAIYMWNA
jgi:hypothetical protein